MATLLPACGYTTVDLTAPTEPTGTGVASGDQPAGDGGGAPQGAVREASAAAPTPVEGAGSIRVAPSSASLPVCDDALHGATYYTLDDGIVWFCNGGSEWQTLTSAATVDDPEREAAADGAAPADDACDGCGHFGAAFGIYDGVGELVGYPVQGSPTLSYLVADKVFANVDFVTGAVSGRSRCADESTDCTGTCYVRADETLREGWDRSTVEGIDRAFYLVRDAASTAAVTIRSAASAASSYAGGASCVAASETYAALAADPYAFAGISLPLRLPVGLRFLD
jgi:hypothetical protein